MATRPKESGGFVGAASSRDSAEHLFDWAAASMSSIQNGGLYHKFPQKTARLTVSQKVSRHVVPAAGSARSEALALSITGYTMQHRVAGNMTGRAGASKRPLATAGRGTG